MGHEEPRPRVLREDLRQEEEVGRRLQQPPVRRPARVEEPEHAVVVGEAHSPAPRSRHHRVYVGSGQPSSWPWKCEAVDRDCPRWGRRRRRCAGRRAPARCRPGGAGHRARSRDRAAACGLASSHARGKRNCGSSASRWCSAVVADPRQADDDHGPLDGVTSLEGAPRTTARCAGESSADSRRPPRSSLGIASSGEVDGGGGEQLLEAELPAVEPEIAQAGVAPSPGRPAHDAEITDGTVRKSGPARDWNDACRPT